MDSTFWTAIVGLVRAYLNNSGEIPEWLTVMGMQADTQKEYSPSVLF
jgi:hypothetical protein